MLTARIQWGLYFPYKPVVLIRLIVVVNVGDIRGGVRDIVINNIFLIS